MPNLCIGRQRSGSLAFLMAGHGPPVLFLHGIGSSADSFSPQLDGLATGYRVMAWDAPGYAGSDDPAASPGMDGYAAAAARLLEDLGAVPAHVVGVSWGGVIAVRLARSYPSYVTSLVLADSTRGSGRDLAKAAAMRRRGQELTEMGAMALAAARAPRLLSPAAPPELVRNVTNIMAAGIRNPGYGWAADAMADTDHTADLAELDLPSLIVVGERDTVATVVESREIARRIAGSRLEVIANVSHMANQERPDHFNRLLSDFFSEVEMS